MAADHIPQELVYDILLKLPVKSLVRFKTVLKNWYSLLSPQDDHNFAKIHLKQSESASDQNLIFFKIESSDETTWFQSLNIDTHESFNINFPLIKTEKKPNNEFVLIGSANGLICVALTRKGECFIWNPCTGECKKISVPVSTAGFRLSGFGYDSCSDDYKIVGDWGKQFRVFSLKTNSWKILVGSDSFNRSSKAVHLNGVLHWSLSGRTIAAFDLATEKFFYMKLPEEVESFPYYDKDFPLFDYQGLLCASGGKSIWVMKRYGDSKSWVKLTTFVAPKEHLKPVSISTIGEVVFLTGPPDDRFEVEHDDGRISDENIKPIRFKESLSSPKCFDHLHHQYSSKKIIKRRPRKQRKIDGSSSLKFHSESNRLRQIRT